MPGDPEAALRLAHRLRELREQAWPGRPVGQKQLGQALGVSAPLISSWERGENPVLPPEDRLRQYAHFFATSRSLDGNRPRMLPESDVTREERGRRAELERELLGMRSEATGQPAVLGAPVEFHNDLRASPAAAPWRFPPRQDVTIVCAALPAELRKRVPRTDPRDPDYIRSYEYADLDSLLELYGHLRAVNPDNQINIRVPSDVTEDDLSAHLVILGGVDWNAITRGLQDQVGPVRQVARPEASDPGAFEVVTRGERVAFTPTLADDGTLVEDVAHFLRAPNPYNRERTLTLCNGMFARGVYGAVRALTDARFRNRNAAYLEHRIQKVNEISILCRVKIVADRMLVPDWTLSDNRLYEWPALTR
jgi:transcriptional regulator with XRE-family HTH domain